MSGRQSSYRAYRGSAGAVGAANYMLVSADTRQMKEKEKAKMQRLNNRLVTYIDKVHDLEMANKVLAAENARLRKVKKEPEQDVAAIFDEELKRLRAKNEEIHEINMRLQIERDNAVYDAEEISVKLEVQVKKSKDLEEELKSLRKDVDDATIERASLEGKLETLAEQRALEKQVNEAEMENLRSQIQPVEGPLLHSAIDANQSSILPDLNEAIASVRKQYEALNAKSLEDLDNFYKEKLENVNKQLKATKDEIQGLRQDNADKRKEIHRLEMELEALKGKKDALERSLDNLEERMKADNDDKNRIIDQLNKDLDATKQDVGKYLKDYQDLNALKMSLDQEISIYQKLIVGESIRLEDLDTSHAGRAGHSSDSSDSESDSDDEKKAKKSKSPKSPKKTEAIVEEMLEKKAATPVQSTPKKEEPGTISVSWKVKGGTVRPTKPFMPEKDAEMLHKAMKGFGTDEEAIIKVLANRTKAQRQVIASHFQQKFNKDLLKELESECSGDFKVTIQHLMWKRSVLDAQALRKAIKGFGTDESVLIEILCTQASREIVDIKKDYTKLFERDLDKDIAGETKGQFKTFLQAILKARRPVDSGTVVANQAEDDAKALFAIQVKNWSPSNPTFLEIFTQRSFQHLWYLFQQCWPKLSKDNLMEQIEKECKGELKRGLKTLIRFSTQIPPIYYAVQLHDAVAGKGTEDKQLIYIITTRSEVDLIDIKEEYFKLFKKPLPKVIEEETSGNYEKLLVAILE